MNSFKKGILIQLGVSPDLSDRSDGGLCQAYEKYKAYLQASKTYGEMMSNKSWVGDKLTGADIIQLFISKSFFHSHFKKFFSKVSNYPDLVDWLSTLHSPTLPIGLQSDCSESTGLLVESEWTPSNPNWSSRSPSKLRVES